MTDKELAEKVAERLGLQATKDKLTGVMYFADKDRSIWIKPCDMLSWSIFGLIIEKTEVMGWELIITEGKLYFSKDSEKGWGVTCPFDIKEHGYCKVIALAFLEVE